MKELINETTNVIVADKIRVYTDIFHKTRGLMFSRPLKKNEAVILKSREESKFETSIHMFFVFFTIDVVWVNDKKEVVDVKNNIKSFTPLIIPRNPARYIIELPKGSGRHFKIGNKVNF